MPSPVATPDDGLPPNQAPSPWLKFKRSVGAAISLKAQIPFKVTDFLSK